MKPFQIFTSNVRFIRYQDLFSGRNSSQPERYISEWLDENVGPGRWEFRNIVETNPCSEILADGEKLQTGATFFFDSEEDMLMFTLRWLTNNQDIMWHPV